MLGIFSPNWSKKDVNKRIKLIKKERDWFYKGKNAEKRMHLLVIERLNRIILIYKNDKDEAVHEIAKDTIKCYVKYATDPEIKARAKEGLIIRKPKAPKVSKLKVVKEKAPKVSKLKVVKEKAPKVSKLKVVKEKAPRRTKKENIELLQSGSAEERLNARQALKISTSNVILVCPHCGSLFHEFSPDLNLQWMFIKNGGTMAGGLIIHCPKCAETASVQQYYETSCKLNMDTEFI